MLEIISSIGKRCGENEEDIKCQSTANDYNA